MTKPMSKLDDLIANLCPDGVEYKALYKIVDLIMGTSPKGETISNNPIGGIEFHQGKSYFGNMMLQHSKTYTTAPLKIASAGSIIMSVRAPVGDSNITEREISIGRGLCAMKGKSGLDTKFLYYFIKANVQEFIKKAKGSTFEAINTDDIKSVSIPLPPLPVQQEIVRILDKFTELEAELEAELVARTKQYEYYRDKLLTTNQSAIEVKLKEVTKERFWIMPATPNFITEKMIPYITSKNIRKGNIDFDNVKYISDEDYKIISNNRPILENDILISMIGTLGEIAIVKKSDLPFYGQNMFLLRLDEKKIDIRFFYHFFDTNQIKEHFNNIKNASSQGYLKAQHIEGIIIPVPPLAEQERIVAILDRFDSLVNDITTGLPAEIAARRKQYEYYRDKLLTFREKAS
jgi:type I restriction enzyme S subunit